MTAWPKAMSVATAAQYLDMGVDSFRQLNIPAFQLTARGDRRWDRDDLDAYVEKKKEDRVTSRVA